MTVEGFKDKGATRTSGPSTFTDNIRKVLSGNSINKVILDDSNVSEKNMMTLVDALHDGTQRIE